MRTIEIIWRGSILVILAYLAWSSFVTGGMATGYLMLLCMPVWLFIAWDSLSFP
jgi:hypothetical protein